MFVINTSELQGRGRLTATGMSSPTLDGTVVTVVFHRLEMRQHMGNRGSTIKGRTLRHPHRAVALHPYWTIICISQGGDQNQLECCSLVERSSPPFLF